DGQPRKGPLISRRDAARRVPTGRAILLHPKILGKLTVLKPLGGSIELVCDQRGGTNHRGPGRHQRRGRRSGSRFLLRAFLLGSAPGGRTSRWTGFCWCVSLVRVYRFTYLLTNSRRISLAVQFGEKRIFLKRIARPQQFEEWIRAVGSRALLAFSDRAGDKRAERGFQLRRGIGLAGEEVDELADTLALFFCAGREFDAHAMSGMHDPDQTFRVNLQPGGTQAQVNGRGLREGRFGLHVASAQTQIRQFTLANRVGFLGQSIARTGSQPVAHFLTHLGVHVESVQAGLTIGGTPCNLGLAFNARAAGKLEREVNESRGW